MHRTGKLLHKDNDLLSLSGQFFFRLSDLCHLLSEIEKPIREHFVTFALTLTNILISHEKFSY